MRTGAVVVGAGLSGMYAADLLTRRGVQCVVLEARDRIGGRILSISPEPAKAPGRPGGARYDLGPAWFWPDMQPRMRRLVDELGLAEFPQYSQGAVLVERAAVAPPLRYERGFNSEPRAMRLAGGMQSLAEAVAARLPLGCVQCGARVIRIGTDGAGPVDIEAAGAAGQMKLRADTVILALPPRLVAGGIDFAPALPSQVRDALAIVPTWMAGQAKILALYDNAFWRGQGLSGTASSVVGPLAEVHDATAPDGLPALFGFVGLSARARHAVGPDRLKQLAVAQLVRLFGPQAGHPVGVFVADWAVDPCTAMPSDGEPPRGHPEYGPLPGFGAPWDRRLIFAGTEVAPEHGGYLEGAIESAIAAVEKIA